MSQQRPFECPGTGTKSERGLNINETPNNELMIILLPKTILLHLNYLPIYGRLWPWKERIDGNGLKIEYYPVFFLSYTTRLSSKNCPNSIVVCSLYFISFVVFLLLLVSFGAFSESVKIPRNDFSTI